MGVKMGVEDTKDYFAGYTYPSGAPNTGSELLEALDIANQNIAQEKKGIPFNPDMLIRSAFTIDSILREKRQGTYTSIIVGGNSQHQNFGYTSVLTLQVVSDTDIPVKKLVFKGISSVKTGDRIVATMPIFDKQLNPWYEKIIVLFPTSLF